VLPVALALLAFYRGLWRGTRADYSPAVGPVKDRAAGQLNQRIQGGPVSQPKLASFHQRSALLHAAADELGHRVLPRPPEGVISGAVKDAIAVVARLAIALIFLWSGVGKFLASEGATAYMQQFGVPFAAVLVWAVIALELGGGLALVLGWRTRLTAAALALFTLVAAVIFHAFWAADAAQALNEEIHFMKNVAIFGGLLMLVAHGAGRYGLDAQRAS
jgi:putative oxidoreductase